MQTELIKQDKRSKVKLDRPYSVGSYNNIDGDTQYIRLSEGCPNGCTFCAETKVNGREPKYYDIPKIERNIVKIVDMNLIYKHKALEIMNALGRKRVNKKVVYYELWCGIDYRFLTQELAACLKKNRFIKPRLAWDHGFNQQKRMKKAIEILLKAGYRSRDIMVFVICNWKIIKEDNVRKLDLLKIWRVKVGDCYFDNQLMPNVKPIHWTLEQIKSFRKMCRKHNQLVSFGIDPETKGCL